MSDTPHEVLTPDAEYVYYRRLQAAEAELAAAQALTEFYRLSLSRSDERIAELEKDAERYRWLRANYSGSLELAQAIQMFTADELDAAIDAARAKEDK